MPGSLDGQVALITGAVRRNGRAMAHALAADGAAVVINARRSAGEAQQVRAEIESKGGRALVCLADITDEAAVERMFADIDAHFGRLDILVNNAADPGWYDSSVNRNRVSLPDNWYTSMADSI